MKLSKLTSLTLGSAMCLLAQTNFTPPTPLFREVMRNNTAAAKQHLAEGADPNQGPHCWILGDLLSRNATKYRALQGHGGEGR